MKHVHPFPARMAPEIALAGLEHLPPDYVVLDPMSGSGMVLGTAAKLGLSAIGYDLDPLAHLISKVNGTQVDPERVKKACERLVSLCANGSCCISHLPWIDKETKKYIEFWFAEKQQKQLSALSYFLIVQPFITNKDILDILKIAVSRLIITKEPKASRARDTAHSRPHRTLIDNNFDVLFSLPSSLDHVLKALAPDMIKTNVKVYRGDARKIGRISNETIDSIVTSPPYLNAIDYMRGHRLSLVWLGFSIPQLRKIRQRSVGAEHAGVRGSNARLKSFFDSLPDEISNTHRKMLERYEKDLCFITNEAFRVLKPNRMATYVIGNSRIKGFEIRNSELLISAAIQSGFRIVDEKTRDIPENRRYMPLANSSSSNLSKRMRTEHVLTFMKA